MPKETVLAITSHPQHHYTTKSARCRTSCSTTTNVCNCEQCVATPIRKITSTPW